MARAGEDDPGFSHKQCCHIKRMLEDPIHHTVLTLLPSPFMLGA